ncbi:hypothetical protein DM01DRAFT_1047808 [Hesseltinella vesiculosa]|uniref:Uncharacterized protein n=1 Tax=Hesseltinella vesiculosa TaxID=101127 RepID=A0A1X2GH35_9FUNG|nr:hypothetical protein DM01DRAFT_1047808 [Hesseltinella vesiculosa]
MKHGRLDTVSKTNKGTTKVLDGQVNAWNNLLINRRKGPSTDAIDARVFAKKILKPVYSVMKDPAAVVKAVVKEGSLWVDQWMPSFVG